MADFSCSLCISTYNRPEALRLCLQTVFLQTTLPDELIIGDDGSTNETNELIKEMSATSPVPIVHIWQPDDGFRLAAIRNQSFATAKGKYIIQIDGDLLLHPNFIADHKKWARPGTFVSGARSLLSPLYTNKIIVDRQYQYPDFFSTHLLKKYNALQASALTFLNYLWQRGYHNYKYVLGANMAFWKTDLIKVNGYDESFEGWGKEDNELAVRMLNSGVAIRFVKFNSIIYHLHHKEASRENKSTNEQRLQKSIANKTTFAEKGLDNYLK